MQDPCGAQAVSFALTSCEDPECGPHFLALDHAGNITCEIVISPQQALEVIDVLKAILYEKATERDEK